MPPTNGNGRVTVPTAGTQVVLSSVSRPYQQVDVQALNANANTVSVGGSGVSDSSPNGIQLSPGQVYSFTLPNDLKNLFVNASHNGDGVSYVWYV